MCKLDAERQTDGIKRCLPTSDAFVISFIDTVCVQAICRVNNREGAQRAQRFLSPLSHSLTALAFADDREGR